MQQVNLYQPILRKERKLFSAVALAQTLVFVSVALLTLWGYGYWQVGSLEREVARAELQRQQGGQRLEQLRVLYPARPEDETLARRLAAAEADLQAKQRMLAALSQRSFGNTAGFVPHFEGLARQQLEGLWLTRIEFSRGGVELGLQGKALRPELLPRYLRSLGAEPAFGGTEFQSFVMTRPEQRTGVEFVLHTGRPAP